MQDVGLKSNSFADFSKVALQVRPSPPLVPISSILRVMSHGEMPWPQNPNVDPLLINSPLNRDYHNRDPNIQALKEKKGLSITGLQHPSRLKGPSPNYAG